MSSKTVDGKISSRSFVQLGFMATAIWLLSSFNVDAVTVDRYWAVSSGDWSTGSNWSPHPEPDSDDNAYIANGGTATITQSGVCDSLYLGLSGIGNTSTVQMTDGSLNANWMDVGFTNTGIFNHSGGTNTITNFLVIGSFSNGTYNLSGSGKLITGAMDVGFTGTGTFYHSAGTNTVSSLSLGYSSVASGTYNLTGGILILNSISKGSGAAAFNFGGGTIQANDNVTTTLPMKLTGIGGNANVDTAGYAVTFSGVLSDTGGLNKLGNGKLTLNTLNTYSGDTTIKGGTLEIAGGIGPFGTSFIDIQSGKAVFKNVDVNKMDLTINTAPAATFEVASGAHSVGAIGGGGNTQVNDGASLTAVSISQDRLTLGAGAKVCLLPLADGPLGGVITPVPEPSSLVLLLGTLILLILFYRL